MRKRIFSLLIVLCLAISLFPSAAAAEVASGTCGENLTWVLEDNGTLIISGKGPMGDYYGGLDEDLGEFVCSVPWYSNRSKVEHIVLESGVTTIGDYAFFMCSNLKDIKIPGTVKSIGDYAFWYCGQYEEDETEGFRHVTIPNGVTEIGEGAFLRCVNLTSVSLPDTLTTVGESAFCYTDLESVNIPGSLTVIPEDMFFEVRSLNYVTLNEGTTRIESGAFAYCGPDVMVIPSTVEYIGSMAFSWCTPLERFVVYSEDCVFDEEFYYPYGIEWNTDFYGYAGSTTETYAAENSFDFYEIPAFTDVPGDSFYFAPVAWALENNITNGLTATEFGPNAACNRAQVVTFLWRAEGCPEPTATSHSFVDVQAGSFYEKAVLWAVEQGIANGLSATEFGPNAACNRAQVVTFLWRAEGCPEPTATSHSFVDVQAGSFYEKAVLWAVEQGISNGLSATEFGPNANCNRAQVVTFLYRAYTD